MKLPHNFFDIIISTAIMTKGFSFGRLKDIVPLESNQEFVLYDDSLIRRESNIFYKFLDIKSAEIKCSTPDGIVQSVVYKKKYFFEVFNIDNGESLTVKFKFSSKTPNFIFIFVGRMPEPIFPEFEKELLPSFPMREEFGEYVSIKISESEEMGCAPFSFITDKGNTKLGDYQPYEIKVEKFLKEKYSTPALKPKIEEMIILQEGGEGNLEEFQKILQ